MTAVGWASLFRVAICPLFFAAICAGTSVVAVMTSNRIVLGADSKATASVGIQKLQKNTCKIVLQNNVVASFAGVAVIEKRVDAEELMRESIRKSPTDLNNILIEFEHSASRKYQDAYRVATAADKKRYHLEVMLMGAPKQYLEMIVASYKFSDEGEMKREFFNFHSDIKQSDMIIENFGADEGVQRAEPEARRSGMAMEDFVRKVLQYQFEITPQRSGPPISIVRIDNIRASWIDSGVCPLY
jgi:ATP-dependent protease HslVU (ClpYQ) peptidase subunit